MPKVALYVFWSEILACSTVQLGPLLFETNKQKNGFSIIQTDSKPSHLLHTISSFCPTDKAVA
jgi:hypothetical protein